MLLNLKTKIWFKALVAAIVTGVSQSALSGLSIATANGVGVDIPKLDWKQLSIMTVTGGLVGMFSYLAKSPVPASSTGNTEIINKTDTTP